MHGAGCKVQGAWCPGCRVYRLGCTAQGARCRVLGVQGVQGVGFTIEIEAFWIQEFRFRVQVQGCRIKELEFRV